MPGRKTAKGIKKLSSAEKVRIISWREEGVSATTIADRLGRHRSSIKRLLAKARVLPKYAIPERKKGSGRPATLPSHALKVLERYVKKYPRSSARIIKQEVPEMAGLTVRYINHLIFKRLKIPSRIAAQKPLLTKKMKERRLAFAKKYRQWTEEDWAKVMFSDESTFRCLRATRSRVRRPTGSDRFDSRYTVKTVKHPDSVMVWGCFAGNGGREGLYFLPKNETMNSVKYLQVLKDHLLSGMERFGCSHFLQDGAPCHASKMIKSFLNEQPFEVMDWPGNSPDLNPIENCWNQMKNKLKEVDTSSLPKLKDALLKLWTQDLSYEYLASLSASMPSRIAAVIKNGGDMTKY
jgi:transposase